MQEIMREVKIGPTLEESKVLFMKPNMWLN